MPLTDPEIAIAAAVAGALIVIDLSQRQDLKQIDKGANDFATQADIEAENAILDIIRRERPEDGIIAEESGVHPARDPQRGRVWLVDPLCGTLNYAAGTHDVAVNIALQNSEGQYLAAAISQPFTDELFWTDGVNAYIRRHGVDKLLSPPQPPSTTLVEINFHLATGKAVRLPASEAFRERFALRVLSTTLPVPWVAAGRRAAYVTSGKTKNSVHYAAGIAVCNAAGCVVTGIDGLPLDSSAGGLIVAADQDTHKTLLDIIQTL